MTPNRSQKITPTTCTRCSQIILTGIAEALTIRLDPNPLTPTTELDALLAGRLTWQMNRQREAWWRSSGKIAAHPAGNHRDYAVLADHRCNQPIPSTITGWLWTDPKKVTPIGTEPGF